MSRINLNRVVQLRSEWSDEDVAELQLSIDGLYRLKTRQLLFVGQPEMFTLNIHPRSPNDAGNGPTFGALGIKQGNLYGTILCTTASIELAHRAFPALAFADETAEPSKTAEVAHEL